jgi:hypothetical protein
MLTHLTTALDGAKTLACVNALGIVLIRAHAGGAISDADAELATAHIEAARRRIRPPNAAPALPVRFSIFPIRRRRCVSPDRRASRDRRRRLGLAGAMPHALAARFTEGERAVLAIVAAQVKAKGVCDLPLEAIAARAGVCVTGARGAIRLAAAAGLVAILERRRPGRPNLPNLVRIVSPEWRAWVWRRGGGCRKANPTDNKDLNLRKDVVSPKADREGKKAAKAVGDDKKQARFNQTRNASPQERRL